MAREVRPATAPSVLTLQHPSVDSKLDPHESVRELREFLKVARPEWSHFCRKGTCDIDKVMAKLKSIGVNDYWDLMTRVETNTINEDLHAAGKVVFSKKTLEQFRRQKSFLSAMEHLRAPFYRQAGPFAPAPQLLSRHSLFAVHSKTAGSSVSSIVNPPPKQRLHSKPGAGAVDSSRPASAGGDLRQKRSDAVSPFAIQMAAASGQRPYSVPTGIGRKPSPGEASRSWRCGLRYVQTGRQDQSGSCITKESLADAADANEEATQSLVETMARSRSSLEFSSVNRTSAAPDYPESDVDSFALEHQFARFKKAGSAMARGDLPCRWNSLTTDTLLPHGEAMLEEQNALDMKKAMMIAMSRDGPQSTTRKVVASNIRHRLREEGIKDAKANLDCHYDCVSIRKNLNAMVNCRRDLNNVKMQAIKALGEEDKVDYAEKFGFMGLKLHDH